jgi:hypothetical protein
MIFARQCLENSNYPEPAAGQAGTEKMLIFSFT